MRKTCFKTVLFNVAAVFAVGTVSQAAPPDAGQLLREGQQQKTLPRELPKPEEEKQKKAVKKAGINVKVTAFTFADYEGLVTEEELQGVVAPYIGKELSFADLQQVMVEVTEYLKSKGWLLARAYLPRQDITEGAIKISILAGKSDGTLTVSGDSTLRIREMSIQRIGEHAVKEGEVLKQQKLERAALLMNDLPGLTAKLALQPGSKPGTSAVDIKASEDPLFTGAVWGDNYGNRYTGAYRANAMLNINDPLRIGDQGGVRVTGAEGLIIGGLNYSIPLMSNGLRASVDTTFLHYELGEEFEDLDADGDAFTANVGIYYPWIRSRMVNLSTTLAYEYKDLTDAIGGVDIDDKTLNSGILTAQGDILDTFGGGGLTSWSASVTVGDMSEDVADIEITDVEGSYSYFNAGLARLQRITGNLLLNASWRGQFATKNLDSSEQFSLGGPDGVRAYPVSEGLGDEGHLFTIETRYDLPIPERYGSLSWKVFYDAGYITLHKDLWENAIDTATNENDYWLHGIGTGFDYMYGDHASARFFAAYALGDNDGRDTDGNNADGEDNDYNIWVQVVWQF